MAPMSKTVWLRAFLDEGVPTPEHFEVVESEAPRDEDLEEGQVLIKVLCMSVDPYLRGRIKSTAAGADVGEGGRQRMSGFISGKVLASRHADWVEGDLFGASAPFCTLQIVEPSKAGMRKLTGAVDESNISYGVGVLGMPGSTAYAGVVGVLRAQEGETIFVNAASGAVGSIAGQIAKNVFNCTTIGTCGGPEKCELITSKFGYDHAIDYRALGSGEEGRKALEAELKELAPNGLDMVFENVGGFQFEAAFNRLGNGGRVAVCGVISGYNERVPPQSSIRLWQMIYTGQRIEGFMCAPWLMGKRDHFFEDMKSWLAEGKVANVEETFYDGIDQWPAAFQSLFEGSSKNRGKVVVRTHSD